MIIRNFDKNLSIEQSFFAIEIGVGQKEFIPIIIQKKQRNIQFKKILNLSDDDDDDDD